MSLNYLFEYKFLPNYLNKEVNVKDFKDLYLSPFNIILDKLKKDVGLIIKRNNNSETTHLIIIDDLLQDEQIELIVNNENYNINEIEREGKLKNKYPYYITVYFKDWVF